VGRPANDRPDILVMYDGPDVIGTGLLGWPSIRKVLEQSRSTLVLRGHAYWHVPLATLANGTQVLNVDARVIVLQPTTR
jgi:Icc protein